MPRKLSSQASMWPTSVRASSKNVEESGLSQNVSVVTCSETTNSRWPRSLWRLDVWSVHVRSLCGSLKDQRRLDLDIYQEGRILTFINGSQSVNVGVLLEIMIRIKGWDAGSAITAIGSNQTLPVSLAIGYGKIMLPCMRLNRKEGNKGRKLGRHFTLWQSMKPSNMRSSLTRWRKSIRPERDGYRIRRRERARARVWKVKRRWKFWCRIWRNRKNRISR